jgi:ABC-type uncharacterized transport system substrate-binding protein
MASALAILAPDSPARDDPAMTRITRALLTAAALACAGPALAHPHVFVVVTSEVIFDAQGRISGVSHSWTFDDMYSSFVTTGASEDGKPVTSQKLQPLAEQNVSDLAEFGYFTSVKVPGQKIEYGKPQAISMHEDAKKLVTLKFTLPLKTPVKADKAFTLQVYDPTYFVSFDFAKDGVSMKSAPAGCSLSVVQPQPLGDSESKRLNEAFFSGLSPGADFGIKLASRVTVACP